MAVVGDVEVQIAVVVEVAEQSAQAPLLAVQTRLERHFPEGDFPAFPCRTVVQVEPVGQAVVVLWEGAGRFGDALGQVDVTGHEEVGPAVGVQVAGDRTGVPFRRVQAGCVRPFAERAVSLVPQQGIGAVGGHEEVGAPVAVEVSGDTAGSAHRQVGAGLCADVSEHAALVAIESVPRQAATAPASRRSLPRRGCSQGRGRASRRRRSRSSRGRRPSQPLGPRRARWRRRRG